MITKQTKLGDTVFTTMQSSPKDIIIMGRPRQYSVWGPVTINEIVITYKSKRRTRYCYGFTYDGIQFPASVYGRPSKEMFPSERAAQQEVNRRNGQR